MLKASYGLGYFKDTENVTTVSYTHLIFHAKNPGKPVRLSDYNQIVRPAHYRAASRLFWNHFHNAELTSLSFYKPVPVSYTHLDVYKRQVSTSVGGYGNKIKQTLPSTSTVLQTARHSAYQKIQLKTPVTLLTKLPLPEKQPIGSVH